VTVAHLNNGNASGEVRSRGSPQDAGEESHMEVMTQAPRRCVAAGLFAMALLSAAAIGNAEPVVRRQNVSYADLDLNSPAGLQTLQRRIRAAVKVVCGPTPELRELNEMRAEQECRYKALQQATARVEQAIGGAKLAAR
jgi:UrcA family protein